MSVMAECGHQSTGTNDARLTSAACDEEKKALIGARQRNPADNPSVRLRSRRLDDRHPARQIVGNEFAESCRRHRWRQVEALRAEPFFCFSARENLVQLGIETADDLRLACRRARRTRTTC